MEKVISDYLLALGLSPALTGYKYIAALLETRLNKLPLFPLYKVGYPLVSKIYGVSAQSVEKCIQNCIAKAWLSGDLETQQREFGATIAENRDKPGVKHFLMHAYYAISSNRTSDTDI